MSMKPIRFEHDGKKYTLNYTLDTAASANADGFVLEELGSKPAQMIPKLVYWSFVNAHKGISRKKVEAIYAEMKNKTDLINALTERYVEAVEALLDRDDGKDTGNVEWTVD